MQREMEALRHQLQSLEAQLESSRDNADATRACLAAAEQGIAALEAVRSELQERGAELEDSAASQAIAVRACEDKLLSIVQEMQVVQQALDDAVADVSELKLSCEATAAQLQESSAQY